MPKPPQLTPLDVKEQRLYSELLTLSLRERPATLRRKLISFRPLVSAILSFRSLPKVHDHRSPDTTCDPIPDHSDYPDLSKVPPCYYDLKEVFNKTKATSLPRHREWDCAIELLPGAPERHEPKCADCIPSPVLREKAMEEYITASLGSGIIRPSSSTPAGAGFFFVGQGFHQTGPTGNAYHLCQNFLGYAITANHISMDPETKVDRWLPTGLLSDSSKKKAKYSCETLNDKAEEAFNKLKQKFTTVFPPFLSRNMTPRGGPGKLRNHWEDVVSHSCPPSQVSKDIPVYELRPEKGKGRSRILHRNLLLSCDHLPLETQVRPRANKRTVETTEEVEQADDEVDEDDEYYSVPLSSNNCSRANLRIESCEY
ncbi:hypothetical protein L3Q82_006396 [Scortum barcoo]|uniref:Uncharacterized protein n=1 Tax=Scortum barcoo TaxID=214431 RepID=A0ACB8WZ48_9TELE|nr:hypothetical protein L3Q82_006396 [Scortum barcoo]